MRLLELHTSTQTAISILMDEVDSAMKPKGRFTTQHDSVEEFVDYISESALKDFMITAYNIFKSMETF